MGEVHFLMRDLREVTSRLALDAQSQFDYLSQLGTAPMVDELALEFDDAYNTVAELRARDELSDHAVRALDEVNSALSAIPEELWTEQALRTAPEWQRVRELATNATTQLA